MRIIVGCFGIIWLILSACVQDTSPSAPNIVLFLVDDLGWQDTSVPLHTTATPLNDRYHTPNMERLAKEGMVFTQAYATSVCSPSRISLMTGMNAARHRVTNWTLRRDTKTDGASNAIETPAWNVNGLATQPGIPQTVVAKPLPQLLQHAGYTTIHLGKAHFAAMETPAADPLNMGFDINVAGHAAGAPGSYHGETLFGNQPDGTWQEPWGVPGLEQYHRQDINLTEALTREALHILDTVATPQRPFFLYLSHYAVHTPIEADSAFLSTYLERGLDNIEARYASMVESMDHSLGQVMDYLDEHQLSEQTIILFMSDNGGLSAVARGGEPHTHNAPLNSGKGSAYEGGIRVPMLAKWPGEITPGSRQEQYVIIDDFFPSILEMAGIQLDPLPQTTDGQSFVPFLRKQEKRDTTRPLFWHYPNIWGPDGPGIGAYSAVRQGDWKLIYFHADQSLELYHLPTDTGERNNRAASNPQKRDRLASLLSNYLRDVDAQMPILKATGEQVPLPTE